jgi:hypothetical protein
MREWQPGPDDPDFLTWSSVIFPALGRISIRRLREATGLSEGYLIMARQGKRTPHRRHWKALLELVSPGHMEASVEVDA